MEQILVSICPPPSPSLASAKLSCQCCFSCFFVFLFYRGWGDVPWLPMFLLRSWWIIKKTPGSPRYSPDSRRILWMVQCKRKKTHRHLFLVSRLTYLGPLPHFAQSLFRPWWLSSRFITSTGAMSHRMWAYCCTLGWMGQGTFPHNLTTGGGSCITSCDALFVIRLMMGIPGLVRASLVAENLCACKHSVSEYTRSSIDNQTINLRQLATRPASLS